MTTGEETKGSDMYRAGNQVGDGSPGECHYACNAGDRCASQRAAW